MANVRSVFQSTENHRSVLLLLGPFLLVAADPIGPVCGSTGNFTANSAYDENLSSLLSSISSDSSVTYGFYNLSSGQSPDRVNGIALCRGDVPLSDCRTCIRDMSIEIARQCPVQKEAIIYDDNCLLRYSDQSIFGVVASGYVVQMWNGHNATNVTEFSRVLMELMDGLRRRAAAGNSTRKFAAGNASAPDSKTLYGLAQCTPDLSQVQCNDCLAEAIGRMLQLFYGQIGWRLFGPSCNTRFEEYSFFYPSVNVQVALPPTASPPVSTPNPTTDTTEPPPKGKSSSTRRMIIIVVVSIVAVCLLVISIFCICRPKVTKQIKNDETAADDIITAESLQYDFETVRAATNNFSDENKLGQGGFGSVYKGMLADGQEIAVKRLSRGQGQGDQEFKTEVLLWARLQHRSLVRLLGFCLSGDERLLIYEFMPNSSLDRFIFDPVKR